MTHIDWTCQRVGVCGEPGRGLRASTVPKESFFKRGIEVHHAVISCVHSSLANKEGRLWVWFSPTQCTSQTDQRVQNKVDYWHQPAATVQSRECRLHSALRAWTGNWAPVIIVAQTEPPSPWNNRKGKTEPMPPQPAGTRKICKTGWAGLIISRWFPPPSARVRQ